jgi:pimeloyl-ACP methyl ester carboxylesterase
MNTPPAPNRAEDDPETSVPPPGGLSRRGLVTGVAAAAGVAMIAGSVPAAAAGNSATGSVADAPRLPKGFADTFTDRFVQANGIRQHVVIGGNGPPLLLVHGWPENWYAWRFMMPALAAQYTVIAVDQRGIGLTEATASGYDAGSLAADLAGLMQALGHSRFSVVGHDTGYVISYALAADHRDRVDRLVLAEIPGPPGVGDHPYGPPAFVPESDNNRLWHIAFNRVNAELIVNMVRSNADEYYRYEFAVQGGGQTLPDHAIRYYTDLYTRNRDALRASFGLYRAWDQTLGQNLERAKTKLTLPVLGIGGEKSWGMEPARVMTFAATDVQTAVIPGVGHWVAEQAPDQMVELVSAFLSL